MNTTNFFELFLSRTQQIGGLSYDTRVPQHLVSNKRKEQLAQGTQIRNSVLRWQLWKSEFQHFFSCFCLKPTREALGGCRMTPESLGAEHLVSSEKQAAAAAAAAAVVRTRSRQAAEQTHISNSVPRRQLWASEHSAQTVGSFFRARSRLGPTTRNSVPDRPAKVC